MVVLGGSKLLMSEVPLYRGTLPIRKRLPLGPHSRPVLLNLRWSQGAGVFIWARFPSKSLLGTIAHRQQWAIGLIVSRPNTARLSLIEKWFRFKNVSGNEVYLTA